MPFILVSLNALIDRRCGTDGRNGGYEFGSTFVTDRGDSEEDPLVRGKSLQPLPRSSVLLFMITKIPSLINR